MKARKTGGAAGPRRPRAIWTIRPTPRVKPSGKVYTRKGVPRRG